MLEIKKRIEAEKEKAYEKLRLPTFEDMLEEMLNIGEQVFNLKEKIGYANDIHAMFVKADDGEFEFVGFAGDVIEGDDAMHAGDEWWICNEEASHNIDLNPIEYPHIDFTNNEIALVTEWKDRVIFGKNSDNGKTFFVSCYWIYSLFLKEINFACKAEEIIRHFRKE